MKLRLGKFKMQLTPLAGGELLVLVILIPYCLSVALQAWGTWRHRSQFQEIIEWFHAGHSSSARSALMELIESQPEFAPAYEMLGSLAFQAEEFDEAVKFYTQAIKLRPNSQTAKIGLSASYLGPLGKASGPDERVRTRQIRKAEEALRNIKRKGADYSILKAQILMERGKSKDALSVLESLGRSRRGKLPTMPWLYPYYATLGFLQAQKAEELWDVVEKVLDESAPKTPNLLSFKTEDRAVARREVQGFENKIAVALSASEKSIRNLLRAIQIRPTNKHAHRSLRFALGRPMSQVVLVQKEIRKIINWGEYYRKSLADYDPYFRIVEDRSLGKIIELENEAPDLLSPLGGAYSRIGRWATGETALRRAVSVTVDGKLVGESVIANIQGYRYRLLYDTSIQRGGSNFRSRSHLLQELKKSSLRLFSQTRSKGGLLWMEESKHTGRVVRILNAAAYIYYRESAGIHVPMLASSLELLDKALEIQSDHRQVLKNKRSLLKQVLELDSSRLGDKDRQRFQSTLNDMGAARDR